MSRGAKQLGTRTSPNFLAGKKYAAVSDMLSSILIPIHPVDFHLHVLFSSLAANVSYHASGSRIWCFDLFGVLAWITVYFVLCG